MKKIGILDWGFFSRESTIRAWEKLGFEPVFFSHKDYHERKSEGFQKEYKKFIEKERPDFFFSFNYFAVLAEACHEQGMLYISLLYDNPYVKLYSYTLAYETNRVFLFDRYEYDKFIAGGLKNVYYMTLPGDPEFRKEQLRQPYNPSRVQNDISFVGSLYNEEHNFYERMESAGDEYLNGYLQGVMDAQHKIYGATIIEEALTDEIKERLDRAFPYEPMADGIESSTYIHTNYVIARKLTSLERFRYLSLVGEYFPGKCGLYTHDASVKIPGIKNMGVAEYHTEMPHVFNKSKINLNITLRSIVHGAPLRCLDIIACGGFLLSNYQESLAEMFVPGEEIALFESEEDLIDKIEYYLSHDKEREKIARAGQNRVAREYNFVETFQKMLEMATS